MRQAFSDIGLIGETPFAISLGYDFCAEHECGIRHLEHRFAVDKDAGPGIVSRKSNVSQEDIAPFVSFRDYPKATKTMRAETRLMILSRPNEGAQEAFASRRNGIASDLDKDISTAWSERAFVIRAFSDEARSFVKALHEAILAGDLCIGHGATVAFGRAPLTLAIPSLMPDEVKQKIHDDDAAHARLLQAAKDTGIEDRLKAAGRRYFALKPEWTDYFKSLKGREGKPSDQSKYPVIFFLNPYEQSKNKHGWFTVEELDQWIDGTGPIIKSAEPETQPEF